MSGYCSKSWSAKGDVGDFERKFLGVEGVLHQRLLVSEN